MLGLRLLWSDGEQMNATHTKTIRLRVKDRHARVLREMATEVNQVWNYCNALSFRMIRERGKWMSGFDFSPYTKGASKEFDHIGSSTIQECSENYAIRRRVAKKRRLRWRKSYGKKRSLGWVPFKARSTRWVDGEVKFAGRRFKVWDSYSLSGSVRFRAGCFSEDARGRWFFCVAVDVPVVEGTGADVVGIDLGLKTVAVCSDGVRLDCRPHQDLESAIAGAQRARKKNRVRAIHAKIKNRRKDAQHKFSTALVKRCSKIFVGDVSSTKLIKTKMAKSVHDAGWSSLKTMLKYKSQQAGVVYEEVCESYSTQTCSSCGARSGPRGVKGLGIREWDCECGASHDRDINAARNILALGCGHAPLAVGITPSNGMRGCQHPRVAATRSFGDAG